MKRCVFPSPRSDKGIYDKTNELPKEKTVTANVTKKRLNSKGFKIAQLNIRSMIKNIDEFRMYALNHQHDIICVNETWLDNTVNNHEVELNGYDLVRKEGNRRGGGVEMFIRSMINYKIGLDLMPDNLETITVEITKPKAKPFHLNRWYRPPDTSVDVFTDYEILMQKMDHENKEIICIGDFNCDCCHQKKVRLKNSPNWLTCFSLNNLLKNQHELLAKHEH